ncbi:hypothetical protein STEG23_033882, partial [Scotinomys teguina]
MRIEQIIASTLRVVVDQSDNLELTVILIISLSESFNHRKTLRVFLLISWSSLIRARNLEETCPCIETHIIYMKLTCVCLEK